jgi:hypothetical protein
MHGIMNIKFSKCTKNEKYLPKREELHLSHCNAHDCIFSVMWECIYNAYWFDARACAEIILTQVMLESADFHAWGKTYECEVYNGTSHCVLFLWIV